MASTQPIFRTIQVGHDQHITLDEPIPADVLPLMHSAGPNRYMMNPGTFSRAESITVELAADQNVQQMDFTYDSETSYQTLLADYTAELGPPAPGADGDQSAVWEDDLTRFELFANGTGQGSRVGSQLSNRAPA
jgi:hypothetical protein